MKVDPDLVLLALASPVYCVRGIFRAIRKGKFWMASYTPRITCRNCGEDIWLVGLWRCGCGYTYKGHLLRVCPVCKGLPRIVRCFSCGITAKLPEP